MPDGANGMNGDAYNDGSHFELPVVVVVKVGEDMRETSHQSLSLDQLLPQLVVKGGVAEKAVTGAEAVSFPVNISAVKADTPK